MSAPVEAPEPLRVVAIGGGTGLSVLLSGLKEYVRPKTGHPAVRPAQVAVDITAIVTVTDDGGSSGRLRREFAMLPPGDIRNCLVALSEDEALLSKLFQFRFQSGHGLKGHSFGNLFLTALTNIMGDFPDAVRKSSEVLNIAGKIYPCTASDVILEAILDDDTRIVGETRISRSRRRIREIRLQPRHARPLRESLEAIAQADLITLGPGSLFTSVIPNLLVAGVSKAIDQSPATKAYFVNLMCQPGETTEFRASDHVKAVNQHARCKLLDCAIVNTANIPRAVFRRYAAEHALPVENDVEVIKQMGVAVRTAALLERGPKVRHSSAAVAQVAMDLAVESRRKRLGKHSS